MLISLDNIEVSFGGVDLLKETNLLVQPEDRIGLIGKNGAGKTTLLKLIAGVMPPTSGDVIIAKDKTIGYLPQEMKLHDSKTLRDETLQAFDELNRIEKKIAELNNDIANATNYQSQEYLRKLDVIAELNERYSILGGSSYEADLEKVLLGLGFIRSDFNRMTSEFSGGWRMRVELAKLLLKKPDIILLDEPTNHLDIESIQWLEDFLQGYKGAVILVSHDKAFLDGVCTRTWEISLGKVTDQKFNYSAFVKWKKEQRETQIAAYRNQQKMIEEIEKFIEKFRYKATKAVQVQSRIKQLDKIERIEIEEEDNAALNIKFPPPPRSGKIVINAKNITKKYGRHTVLKDIDLAVEKGDKIAFVGKNGEGKSTLVKIILDLINYEGDLKIGHNVKVGYFAQNQARLLNGELTVFETIDEIAVGDIRTKIRDILGAFLFSGEEVDKKVKVLSGGEKTRLAMIRLMLKPVNLLVLDEPTNHLDIKTKEILKEALKNFEGTIIVVSHDRDFLNGIVDCVYEFKNQKIIQHLGGIYDFLEKKKMESLRELEVNTGKNGERKGEKKKIVNNKDNGNISFEKQKEINRNISRLEKKIVSTEEYIEKLDLETEKLNKVLSSSGQICGEDIFEKYENLKCEMTRIMERWEIEQRELEKWKMKKNW